MRFWVREMFDLGPVGHGEMFGPGSIYCLYFSQDIAAKREATEGDMFGESVLDERKIFFSGNSVSAAVRCPCQDNMALDESQPSSGETSSY